MERTVTEESFSSQKNAFRQERSGGLQERLFERREKGLWSFLTWSFFLSQVVGAEQASAAEARPSGAADDTASTSDTAVGQAATSGVRPPTAEIQEVATGPLVQSLAQAAAPSVFLAAAPAEFAPPGVRSTEDSSGGQQTSAAPAVPVGTQPAANWAPGATPGSELGGGAPGVGDPLLSVIEMPPVVNQVIAPVVDLVGDVVEDVGEVLDSVVEQVVVPVIGIVGDVAGDVVQVLDPVVEQVVAPVIGIVGDVAGDVVQVLDPVVEQVVAPVIGIVGDVVGDVVQVLDPVVEQVVAPVVQVLDPIVEQVVAPVVQALDPVVAPVIEALDPLLAPVADIVGGPLASLLGLDPGGGAPIIMTPVVAASSGSLDFEGAPAAGPLVLDDLFSGGNYTDYNLALQSDVPAGASSAPGAILHDVVDSAGDFLGAVAGNNLSDGENANSHFIGLPSILEEIGLRGSGDGISI
jgi:hypothetical protein